jgi:hypothetical protein
MRGVKTSGKASLIIIALALLACLVWLGSRPAEPDEPVGAGVPDTSRGPSFEVRVRMPRPARPFFGILPERLVARLDGAPREVGFDHASRGAHVGGVGRDRVEFSADGSLSGASPHNRLLLQKLNILPQAGLWV